MTPGHADDQATLDYPNPATSAGKASVTLWPAHACLVSELATTLDQLEAQGQETLAQCQIILPTKRLVPWLYALLARRRTAFVPPRCLTFEDFIALYAPLALKHMMRQGYGYDYGGVTTEDGEKPSAGEARSLGALEQELVLAALLKAQGYRHLRFGHEHEIRQFFSELTAWAIGSDAFSRLADAVAGNAYLSEGASDTLAERYQELEDLWRQFHAQLAAMGCETVEQRQARQSQEVAAYLNAGGALAGGARRLFLVGLTSTQGMHAQLLKALCHRPDTHIWLNAPVDTHGPHQGRGLFRNPLAYLLALLDVPLPMPASPSAPTAAMPSSHLQVLKADNLLAEVAEALSLAKAAIKSGIPPSAVAILVTNEDLYAKPLRLLLHGSGVKANVALATPFASTPLGTWLEALLGVMAQQEATSAVLALLSHPLTLEWWQRQGGAPGLGAAAWVARLTHEICATGIEQGLKLCLEAKQLSPDLRAFLLAISPRLTPLTGAAATKPLAAWAEALAAAVADFLPSDAPRAAGGDDGNMDRAARAGLECFLAALASLPAAINPVLTRGEFLALVRERLMHGRDTEVRGIGDPLRGLQVLGIPEARYVPFELAIILGSTEGDFPRALPKDYLIDNYLKTRIGLPGWQLLEAIEDTTFHLLASRLPAMLLLYPETRDGEAMVRSRFIEAALARGEATLRVAAGQQTLLPLLARHCASALSIPGSQGARPRIDWQARRQRRGAGWGELTSDGFDPRWLQTTSASAIESLIRCPYRFLLQRLQVQATEIPDADDPRREGEWLHAVLEAFFTGRAGGEAHLAEPLLAAAARLPDWETAPGWETLRPLALQRLDQLTAALAPATLAGSALALHLRLFSWPAFIEHLRRLYGDLDLGRAADGARELVLGGDGSLAPRLEVAGRHSAIQGKIDSVDRLGSWHLITDYKRHYGAPRHQVQAGISPQLLVYALALDAAAHDLPLTRAVVGYWSILKGCWQPGIAGSAAMDEARRIGLVPARAKMPLEEVANLLVGHWQWRLEDLTAPAARFMPDPSACEHCEYPGVCRRDDAEVNAAITANAKLTARLRKDEA